MGLISTFLVLAIPESFADSSVDKYNITEGNESMMVALGRSWSAEQAFELYAPGVVEVVAGYADVSSEKTNFYEVILIEYDPTKTSYEVLVDYAFHNMDPFDGTGQFCDRDPTYAPAIFCDSEEEFDTSIDVLTEILDVKNWTIFDIEVEILERTTFHQAANYHQDYYAKNPSEYSDFDYKCKRTERLKEVWGLLEYSCYHDHDHICFLYDEDVSDMYYGGNITRINVTDGEASVVNTNGEIVAIEANIKGKISEFVSRLPRWAAVMIAIIVPMVVCIIVIFGVMECRTHARKTGQWKVGVVQEQQRLEEERKRKQEDENQQRRRQLRFSKAFELGLDLGEEEKKHDEELGTTMEN